MNRTILRLLGPVLAVSACVAAAIAAEAGGNETPAARKARLDRAKKLFIAECAGCHGEKGRGDGPGAPTLPVLPRDFTTEKFKFRSTDSGAPPRRQDIFDTITKGLPGTFMPAFDFLSEEERWLLVDHVRGLARIDKRDEPDAVDLGGPETPNDAASIERGRAAFVKLECTKCHGPEGRGDGPSAKEGLKDAKERPISPRDFSKGVFRRGASATELYTRFRTGLDGTPMPSFAVTPEQGWDLAHFVQSLAKAAPQPLPADAVERGRRVVELRGCNACHVIEGRGGKVGPSLDVSAQKIETAWLRGFLKDPRPLGKIYPYIPFRMPNLHLSAEEIEGVVALFAKVAGRPYPEDTGAAAAAPAPDPGRVGPGTLLYALKCAECHNLEGVIPLYEAKRQGPDLINVKGRVRWDFVPKWVANPDGVYPGTRMVKTNLNADEIESVRSFLWTVSAKHQEAKK